MLDKAEGILNPIGVRRLTAKFEKIIVDVQAASPSSWKTDCMAIRMVS
jgi:hypothetical protein